MLQGADRREAYGMFFDWLHPRFTHLLLRLCETFWAVPAVTKPVLAFYAELVYARRNRILQSGH